MFDLKMLLQPASWADVLDQSLSAADLCRTVEFVIEACLINIAEMTWRFEIPFGHGPYKL